MQIDSTSKLPEALSTHSVSSIDASSRPILVEFKNGKVVLKQKPISLLKQSETLQDIVAFRDMLRDRVEKHEPSLSSIPTDYLPVIAKLAHESDKSIGPLAKWIIQELVEEDDDEASESTLSQLPSASVEAAIKLVLERNNYGLDPPPGVRPPAATSVWRWEVRPAHVEWLPKNFQEKAESRRADRIQAKKDLLQIFDALPEEDKSAILAHWKPSDRSSGDTSVSTTNPAILEQSAPAKPLSRGDENVPQVASVPLKKPTDTDKATKEKQRNEKKAAKIEKEKKEQSSHNKARALMATFFTRPTHAPSKSLDVSSSPSTTVTSDFNKTFRPFTIKKDTYLAATNWFRENAPRQQFPTQNVIILDGATEVALPKSTPVSLLSMNASTHIRDALCGISNAGPSRCQRRLNITVRQLMSDLNEAEVSGDVPAVRSILNTLANRDMLPAKVLIFHEDLRPGYYGTWTRHSDIIKPRNPFKRDTVRLDYGYDSGEEWEEEGLGDADDVLDDSGEEDDGSDRDSDMDSWLVDDDEVEIDGPATNLGPTKSATKRKVLDKEDPPSKKRKIVIPLVPYAKGPFWESSIGACAHESFKSFQVRSFNGQEFPLDPFHTVVLTNKSAVKTKTAEISFPVPSLPQTTPTMVIPAKSSLLSTKKHGAVPKSTVPEVLLPNLLAKVNALQSSSLNFIVESIYEELKSQNVRKNAIEQKVRETSEKCLEKKIWVVKSDFSTLVSSGTA